MKLRERIIDTVVIYALAGCALTGLWAAVSLLFSLPAP